MRKIGRDENGSEYPVAEFQVSGKRLQEVEMVPGYTHSIINLSETEELVTFIWANECFNPSKPDTYYEEV
jgi:UDP-2-acetamido-2,6-beta-L-arabino-hexul-4-ose reductase